MNYRKVAIPSTLALAVGLSFLLTSSSSAFTTNNPSNYDGKWANTSVVQYSIDNNVDSLLVTGAKNTIINNSIGQWNNASRLGFSLVDPPNVGTPIYIKAVDYYSVSAIGGCAVPSDRNTAGATCNNPGRYYNSTDHTWYETKAEIFLNSSCNLHWTTSGPVSSNGTPSCSTPWERSVQNTSMHELSHTYIMDHDVNHQEAVGWPHTTYAVHTLQEDDKHGATLIYGPRTGWEDGFANGEIDTIAFWNGLVGSYDGDIYGYPIVNRTTAEQPRADREVVYPYAGSSWMERFAGCSEQGHSYAYMRLFSSSQDNSTHNPIQERPYVRIKSGMHLKWAQYNFQQRNMSVDFKMVDDAGNTSYLRDRGLTVNVNGQILPVHPGGRRDSPVKQWFFNDVDLSSLMNQKIIEWYIAYDNGGVPFDTRPCAPFRVYIDNLRVEY